MSALVLWYLLGLIALVNVLLLVVPRTSHWSDGRY